MDSLDFGIARQVRTNMVIHEATPCSLIHASVRFAIHSFQQETLQHILANQEVDHQYNANDQSTKRCQH